MKTFKFILPIAFLLFSNCSQQKDKQLHEITGKVRTDINNLLPEGVTHFEVMLAPPPPSDEYKLLIDKMMGALGRNQEWFLQYQKENYKPGQGLPYHENFGITAQEYEKLKSMQQAKLQKAYDGEMLIEKTGSVITISSPGPTSDYNGIRINLDSNIVYIDNNRVPYQDFSEIKDTNNVIGAWKGYKWKLENVNEQYQSLSDLSGSIYSLTIGQTTGSKKSFMILKKQVVAKGQSIENIEIPVMW